MKYLKSFLTIGCIAALAWGISACSEDEGQEDTLQSITVTPASVSLMEGRTEQLVVATVPANITGVNVTYASAHPDVATVSTSGLVTAVATGATTITVSAPGVAPVKVPVTVGSSLTGLTVAPEAVSLLLGSSSLTQQLTVTPLPAGVSGVTLSYASSHPAIASVSDAGEVAAVAEGAATITITGTAPGSNGNITVTATVPVTVGSALTGLIVTPAAVALSSVTGVPNTQQLDVATVPEGVSGVTYTYESSHTNIATVSNTGLVTAVAEGAATITITGALPGITPVTATVPVTVAGIDALFNRSAWTAEATSTLDADVAARMFDGDITTVWHSGTDGLPHGFTADMHGYKRINGFYYYNRRGIDIVGNRAFPKSITVQTSLDNANWTTVYENANMSGKLARIALPLAAEVIARYVKVTVTANQNGAGWTYLAEFGAYNDTELLSAPEPIALISPADNQEHFTTNPLTFSWEVDDPEPANYTLKISRNQDLSGATEFTASGTSKALTPAELEGILGGGSAMVYWSVSATGFTPSATRAVSLIKVENVTGLLTNVTKPFTYEQNNVPGDGTRFNQLTGWTHNFDYIVSYDNVGGQNMVMFANPAGIPNVINGKVYQTVTLDPGNYTLEFHCVGYDGGTGVEAYGVVTTQATLPDYGDVLTDANVLGKGVLSNAPPVTVRVSFTLTAQTAVTLGWVYNTSDTGHGWSSLAMSGIELYRQ